MSTHCVCCGLPLPSDQGSTTCSMCYGDIGHGKDGYYQQEVDRFNEQQEREQEQEQQP